MKKFKLWHLFAAAASVATMAMSVRDIRRMNEAEKILNAKEAAQAD